MFIRRVLWNMPKIKPEDYRQDTQDQILPGSPPIPPLTPPTLSSHVEQPIVHSKRRKRARTDLPKQEIETPKEELTELEIPKVEHGVGRTNKREGGPLWVPVPLSSSKEQLKELHDFLQQDPFACRACGDLFCRDPTWGDPYLISCAKCESKYHSFCVDNKHSKAPWRCYKCQHAPRPVISDVPDDNPATLCQFCNRQSPDVAGKLVVYGGLGDTTSQSNFVHENCAFYSKGVTKREDQWFGLHTAVRESNFTKCSFCHKKGASIHCNYSKCRKLFHYPCAKQSQCFTIDGDLQQHLYCDQHIQKNPAVNATKIPSFQVPLSPESIAQNKKKLLSSSSSRKKVNKRQASVPDGDSEDDSSLSCQVL